jgi:hypothetical protein
MILDIFPNKIILKCEVGQLKVDSLIFEKSMILYNFSKVEYEFHEKLLESF